MEAALANITRIDPTTRGRAAVVVARLRERVDDGDTDPAVLGAVAAEMGMAGEACDRMAEIAARAVVGRRSSATTAAGWSWDNATRSLVGAERYDVAREALDDAVGHARDRGAVFDVGCALTFRGELLVHLGDLAAAEVDARTLHEISTVYGWPMGLGFATAVLGEVLVDRGALDEAAELVAGGALAGGPERVPHLYPNVWVLRVRGRLRRAQGDPAAAVQELRECGRRALDIDHVAPAVLAWRSELAHALLDVGEVAEARRLAADELARARHSGGARAVGIALRAAARAAGPDQELELLQEAIVVLDASRARLERARAHADLGAALRRAGRPDAAREPLRRAVDLAHRCGATALEDAALAELRATGARPRRRATTGAGALTPSERRIAELAAAGQQNREIAETLFVTTATVEYHLRNAYRKLGIGSRTQLPAALS